MPHAGVGTQSAVSPALSSSSFSSPVFQLFLFREDGLQLESVWD